MSLYSPSGFIFIHNRKTGGTTMRGLLLGPLVRYLTIPHESAEGVRKYMRDLRAEGQWMLSFKFAFIRSPYTWVESMRRHAVAQVDHPLRDDAMGEPLDWPAKLAQACRDRLITTDGRLLFQRDMVLGPSGEQILNRLCRFENYNDEVKWILDHLGIEHPGYLERTGEHGVPEIEPAGSYAQAIAEHFAEDFEALNYET